MADRADIIVDAVTAIGGYTGTVGTLTTTSAVLPELANYSTDENFAVDGLLIFPDAVNSTDKQRTVTAWNPTTGAATWSGATTGGMGTVYVFQPRPAYAYGEWDQAIDKALKQTARTYRKVIPIIPNLSLYPLDSMTWLEGGQYVDAAWVSSSPIMNHNEDFSLWWDGPTSAPDGWTLSGSGATVAQVTTGIRSAYAVTVTSGAGADAVLSQSVPEPLVQWLTRRSAATFSPIRASAWIASGQGTVGIYDGSAETKSTLATFTYPSYQETSVTPTATMTGFTIRLTVPAGVNSATFHFGGIWQETTGSNLNIRDMGSQAYSEYLLEPHNVRNVGGLPMVEMPWQYAGAPGQLIVYSRRNFGALTYLDDQVFRAAEAGTIYWLLSNLKAGQDRTRLDAIQKEHGAIWANMTMNLIDAPVPRPPTQVTITGA